MLFAHKLEFILTKLGMSQSKLSYLTGISKSSISQYLSGKNEPSNKRRREIALALGLQEDYFETFNTTAIVSEVSEINLPISIVAKLMGKSKEWVAQGLKDGVFPWGYAVKLEKWSYFVSAIKFAEYTGIEVSMYITHNERTLS